MTLNRGRTILAIPGPSVIPDRVLREMHRASPNIYAGELHEITRSLFPDLQAVARTKNHVAIYIANGHGAWEAALRNTLKEGDEILFLNTGRFAEIWSNMALNATMDVKLIDVGMEKAVDPMVLEDALRKDTYRKIKAVLAVQADTASSAINNVAAYRKVLDDLNHPALLMIDCIACLGCDRFEMDEWGVDVMVAGCQKGLMTPAGVSFVYFNDKAREARKRTKPGTYWDWEPRISPESFYQYFAGTAPTQHIYGLREALTMLVQEEGLEAAWARHKILANSIWTALDAWGQGGDIRHNISDRSQRSHAVSTVVTGPGDATRIREWTEQEAGVTLGIPLGFGTPGTAEWDCHFRIGHMGHLNIHMVMGTLGAIDTAMKVLKIPHGNGALDAAAKVIAASEPIL